VGNKAVNMVIITYSTEERACGCGVLDRFRIYKHDTSKTGPRHNQHVRSIYEMRISSAIVRDSTPHRRDPMHVEIGHAKHSQQVKQERKRN